MNVLFLFVIIILSLSLACFVLGKECQNGVCVTFKTYGLDTTKRISGGVSYPLLLVAAGMRRKFFLDIYSVGLYLSDLKTSASVSAINSAKDFAPVLTKPCNDDACLILTLHLERAVSAAKIVDALVTALAGGRGDSTYTEKLESFRSILMNSIGSAGLLKGDIIDFVYRGEKKGAGNKLEVYVRHILVGAVESLELRSRLLNVYVGEEAVAPELTAQLKKLYLK